VVLDFGREIAGRLLVVLGAMTWLGYPRSALDWMRTYWGGMLAEGAISFWESYDLGWPKDTPHLSPSGRRHRRLLRLARPRMVQWSLGMA
jgi:hypothetical protein